MSPADRIEAAAQRSPLVRAALEKARVAHQGQVRNGSGGMPYVEHPMRVAATLDEHGYRDEVLAAALLHDVIEDSDVAWSAPSPTTNRSTPTASARPSTANGSPPPRARRSPSTAPTS